MKYSKNAVYTRVRNAVKAANSAAYVTGVIVAVPPKSPAVMVQETGRFHNREAMTFGGLQPVRTSTFEAHVFSTKADTGMSECLSLMDTVIEAFVKIGYQLILTEPLDSGEEKKYRMVARFRRVIGSNDEMPEETA